IRRGGQYRKLYAGFRTFGMLPAVILADVHLPSIFHDSGQLARRVVNVPLGVGAHGIKWRGTCNTGDIKGWRAGYFGNNARVADSLVTIVLRDVMPKYEAFSDAAAALGFPVTRDSDDGIDRNAGYRALFDAVCALPAREPTGGRWTGKGWQVCQLRD